MRLRGGMTVGHTHETPSPDPLTVVIFGASGDLTRRKLMPALYNLYAGNLLPDPFAVLGYGRTDLSDDAFREQLREGVAEHSRTGLDGDTWDRFAPALHYTRGSYDEAEGFERLKRRLAELPPGGDEPGNCLFYLSIPPVAFRDVADQLRACGLARKGAADGTPWSRIVIEKPFGRDLASARDLNKHLTEAFDEKQVFRIDHYLGKETVQNLMVLRFANTVFEPIWNEKFIDHIQITVSETVGMEGRGGYYDTAGAIRDIVQNHMMHLVSLVAMEPPLTLDARAVRNEKVKVLRALRRMPPRCVQDNVVRGQYEAGEVGGESVPAYRDEEGVDPDSATETFAAMRLFVDNWRWSGVPFYVRTGKRMPVRITEIGVHFRPIPQVLFGSTQEVRPNVLTVRIQPNEGVSMRFQVKVPGPAMEIQSYQMDFGYAETFGGEPPEAYERLLLDATVGDSTLFTRSDEVEAAWEFVEPILEACETEAERPETYAAGSWGPEKADRLIEDDGREWMLIRRKKKGPS